MGCFWLGETYDYYTKMISFSTLFYIIHIVLFMQFSTGL